MRSMVEGKAVLLSLALLAREQSTDRIDDRH